MTGARGRRAARLVLLVVAAVVWLGLARLAWAFLDEDLQWRYVAGQTRVGAPWYYRLAGVWGGMEGSLLLFAGILGAAGLVATRRVTVPAAWAATATVTAVAVADVALASPFGRLDAPALTGFGLTPILEHPAMTLHPPVLYAGLAAAGGAAVRAAGGDRGPWRSARRWHLATLGVLTVAMALGAVWSYLEQGWGGYWAWDPVENTSLVVWLAALVALHAGPTGGDRVRLATGMAPWCLALAGATIVRSGVAPSIHGFAEQPAIGWALLGLTAITVTAAVWRVATGQPRAASGASPSDARLVTVVLASAALVVVLAGTVLPVLHDVLGGRRQVARGELYSRTVGPLALVAVAFLAGRLRRWRAAPRWSTAAHAGALLLLVGVAASTFDRSATVPIAAGATVEAAGVELRNDGIAVVDGPRQGTSAVVATLRAGGDVYRPQVVVYPERGGRLAEVAARPGAVTDVLVVLESASDAGGAVVTVHVRPLVWLIWLGAAVVSVATLAPAWATLRPRRRPRRGR